MQVNNNKAKLLLIQCIDNACKLISHGKSPNIKPMQGTNIGYVEDTEDIEYNMQDVMPIFQYVDEDGGE